MAKVGSFVKLLRQLSRAKDEYRSGAVDITWEGGTASIYMVFGQPNHATFSNDAGETLEGNAALAALVERLPSSFTVSGWRKSVSRADTITCTLEELMEPIVTLTGAHSAPAPPPPDSGPEVARPSDFGAGEVITPEFAFGLDDFPLLPLGHSMWSEAAASVVHLDVLIPKLPTSLLVLTGPKLRAAAIVAHGQIIDAIWVDDAERAAGEGAAMALMGARQGTVSGYRLDNVEVAEAITMLWRCPPAYTDISASWIDRDRFLASIESQRCDCVVKVDGPVSGVAFFVAGRFVTAYTHDERQPSASIETLRSLLDDGRATLSILQRAGDRPVGRRLAEANFHAFVDAPAPAGPELSGVSGVSGVSEASEASARTAADIEPTPSTAAAAPDLQPEESAAGSLEPAVAAEAAPSRDDPSPVPTSEPAGGVGREAAGLDAAAKPPLEQDAQQPVEALADDAGEARGEEPLAWMEEPAFTEAITPPLFFAAISDQLPPGTVHDGLATDETDDDGRSDAILDFETIKADLIQIGVLWLGNDDIAPVAELIHETQPRVDAFVATIDAIRSLPVGHHDASVIRAMAREMQFHAAEVLCGA